MKRCFVSIALCIAGALPALAQTPAWPSQPVRLIVPAAAGGVSDTHARKVSDELARLLGQPVIVDNRPGANGIIGTDAIAKAKPDGYTIGLVANVQLAVNPLLYAKVPYHPTRDFALITRQVRGVPLLLADSRLPFKSVADLIAYARTRPGQLAYGSPGVGSMQHLTMEAFERAAGLHLVHIPYRAATDVITDLGAGRLQLAIEYATVALPHVQSGRLRAIAVAGGKERKAALPEVPSLAEAGMAQIDGSAWSAFVAPAGTSAEVIGRLQRDLVAAFRTKEYQDYVTLLGADVIGDTPEEFSKALAADIERWRKVIKEGEIKVE